MHCPPSRPPRGATGWAPALWGQVLRPPLPPSFPRAAAVLGLLSWGAWRLLLCVLTQLPSCAGGTARHWARALPGHLRTPSKAPASPLPVSQPSRPSGPWALAWGGSPRMDPAPSYYLLESPAEERWLVPPQGSRSLWTGQPTHLPAPLRAPPPVPPLPPHPHPVPFFCIWKQRVVINLRWMFSPGLWLPLSSGWCWGVTGWGGVFPGPGRWAVGPGTPPTARHPEPSGQVGQGGGGGGVEQPLL